nr:MAG TPA: hypothetical protein [Caudoviricetes sp.]DAN87450.1 MAG TPA: hypothetical protein [Caudoviricetes sp.]
MLLSHVPPIVILLNMTFKPERILVLLPIIVPLLKLPP